MIYNLMVTLVAATDYIRAFCQVDDAMPYIIMHGGNQIGEKMFMLVFMKAWEHCTTKHAPEDLIGAIEHYINTGVFGTIDSQSQWKLTVTKDFKLEAVNFSAWHLKKVMVRLGDIAEHLIQD